MFSKKVCSQLLDGSLTDRKTYVSGRWRGFYVTLNAVGKQLYSVKISAYQSSDPGNAALGRFLEARKNVNKQIDSYNIYNYSINIFLTRPPLVKNFPAHFNEALMPVFNYLATNGYVSGCYECGTQNAQIDCYNVNDEHLYICGNCAQKIQGSLESNKQALLAQKSKLLPGIVGALLGALVGIVVYFVLWQIDIIAALSGLVTAFCAFWGYRKLGSALDKKGIAVCVVIILLAAFLSVRLSWAYDVYSVLREDGVSFSYCFENIEEINSFDSDLEDNYNYNTIMSLGMTALGSVGFIVKEFKSNTGSYKVKKMNE